MVVVLALVTPCFLAAALFRRLWLDARLVPVHALIKKSSFSWISLSAISLRSVTS